MKKIIVEWRENHFRALIEGCPEATVKGVDNTIDGAIGDLVRKHADKLGIRIQLPAAK
jgi:hypothetical protein